MTSALSFSLQILAHSCVNAVLHGMRTVTVSAGGPGGLPRGVGRGELLSVNQEGVHNYAVDPIKVLAWIHKQAIANNAALRKQTPKEA